MLFRAGIRSAFIVFVAFCCAYALVGNASGQQRPQTPDGGDLNALLKRMEVNRRANDRFATRYTYDWTSICKIYNAKGKLLDDNSTKWISVAIGGIEYNRIVEENGKPLSKKKQIAEQKRSDLTGGLGKDYDFVFQVVGMDPRHYIYSDLPVSYLDTLFDNRVVGRQTINGRDSLVVESTPKTDANPHSDREKTALDWSETTWFDIQDEIPVRFDVELVNSKRYLLKGSTYGLEFTRLPVIRAGTSQSPPNVWLPHEDNGHFVFWPKNSEVLHDDYYNYKRFQSNVRMVGDSVQEVPTADPGKHP